MQESWVQPLGLEDLLEKEMQFWGKAVEEGQHGYVLAVQNFRASGTSR